MRGECLWDAGQQGRMKGVEVLGSRILLRPSEPERSRRFYRDTLGLAVYREFGHPDDPGLVFFLGGGFLEISGRSTHALRERLIRLDSSA